MFDLGTTWLKLNYFILTNRQDLRKWWVLTLVAVAIFSTVFVITNVVVYLVNLPKQDALINAIAVSPLDYAAVRTQEKPQSLTISGVTVLPASTGRYDLVAKVENPNKKWAATDVTYEFSLAGQAVGEQTESVMPASEQYLTSYNVSGPETAAGVSGTMAIKNITWVRVPDPSVLPNANFTYSGLKFDSAVASTGQAVYRVTGQATNTSLSGFWKVELRVILLSNNTIVGINSVFLNKFLPGESRSLYSQWDAVSGTPGSISVVPSVNLLDSANIIR